MPDEDFYRQFKGLIPKGIYYESSKRRWRVRLYKAGTVVHLAYHKSYELARSSYDEAKAIQKESTQQKLEQMDLSTHSVHSLINTLGKL